MPIEVEREFSSFVRSIGGVVLEDELGPSPAFMNADYVFHDTKVVVELKRLVENKEEDSRIQNKIQSKFDKWQRDGTVGLIIGNVRINSKDLPLRCQQELIDSFKPPVQRRVVKASKQLKSTKDRLRLDGYKGLLIVVNDGNFALEADAATYLLWRVLGSSFRSINSVIYCTVNMLARTPFSPLPTLVWVHAVRPSVAEPVDDAWANELHRGWFAHLSKITGEPIHELQLAASNLETLRYVREA